MQELTWERPLNWVSRLEEEVEWVQKRSQRLLIAVSQRSLSPLATPP